MKVDPVKRVIWSDIARELVKETDVEICRCYGDEFYSYLQREGELPFLLEKGGEADLSGDDNGYCDLIIGWQVLTEDFFGCLTGGALRILEGSGRGSSLWLLPGSAAG